jgi:hypothetical protein
MKMTAFWDIAPCSPDDGGTTHLWNVRLLQRHYTALYPRRMSSLVGGLCCSFAARSVPHVLTNWNAEQKGSVQNGSSHETAERNLALKDKVIVQGHSRVALQKTPVLTSTTWVVSLQVSFATVSEGTRVRFEVPTEADYIEISYRVTRRANMGLQPKNTEAVSASIIRKWEDFIILVWDSTVATQGITQLWIGPCYCFRAKLTTCEYWHYLHMQINRVHTSKEWKKEKRW